MLSSTRQVVLLFDWTTLGCLGITLGYHRYFSHRQFSATLPLQIALGWMASICWQGSVNTGLLHIICTTTMPTLKMIFTLQSIKSETRITPSSFFHAHHRWMKVIGFKLIESLRHYNLIQARERYQSGIQRFLESKPQQISASVVEIEPTPSIDQQLDDCYAIF